MILSLWLLVQAPVTPPQAATMPVSERKVVPSATAKDTKPGKGQSFYQLLDEVLDEAVNDMAKLGLDDLSPVAIGAVHISPNLSTELEETIVLRLTAMLGKVPKLKQVHCASCFSVRSRVEGGDWVVTRGIVGRDDMKRVATEL